MNKIVRWARAGAPVLTLALLIVSGCGTFFPANGGGGNTTTCTDCLYVSLGNSGSTAALAQYGISSTGLTSIGSNLSVGGAIANTMTVSPEAPFLYVGSQANTSILVYSINSTTGVLTAANDGASIITAGAAAPTSLAVDPTGNYLFILSLGSTTGTSTNFGVSVVPISQSTGLATGNLTTTSISVGIPNAGSTCASISSCSQIVVSPDSSAVYVALGSGGLWSIGFSGGTLATTPTNIIPASSTTSVNGVAVDGDQSVLYAAASGAAGGLYAFNLPGLTLFKGAPFVTGDGSSHSEYAVALSGEDYVYVSNAHTGTVTGYAATSLSSATNSTPAALTGSPYTVSTGTGTYNTTALAVDNTGAYLLVMNAASGPDIAMYTIGSDGSLGSVTSSVYLGGSSTTGYPQAIAVTGSGN